MKPKRRESKQLLENRWNEKLNNQTDQDTVLSFAAVLLYFLLSLIIINYIPLYIYYLCINSEELPLV